MQSFARSNVSLNKDLCSKLFFLNYISNCMLLKREAEASNVLYSHIRKSVMSVKWQSIRRKGVIFYYLFFLSWDLLHNRNADLMGDMWAAQILQAWSQRGQCELWPGIVCHLLFSKWSVSFETMERRTKTLSPFHGICWLHRNGTNPSKSRHQLIKSFSR